MRRQQLTSLINITGLAFGITCAVIIYLILNFAASYNQFLPEKDRLYRLVTDVRNSQGEGGTPGVMPPLPDAFRTDISGVENSVFINADHREYLIRKEDEKGAYDYIQVNEDVAYTEPAYFNLFAPEIKAGSVAEFDLPKKVVLSEHLAEILFANQDAVGQVITMNQDEGYEVIAVMENAPRNSDLPFQLLISYATRKEAYLEMTGWGSVSSDDQLYLRLEEGESMEAVNAQLTDFAAKHFPDDDPDDRQFRLQPLEEWHSDDRYVNYSYKSVSDASRVSMLLVGIFLIITACVNFVNLKTALALRRTREIGIRKVLGSGKKQLIGQFLGETFLTVLIAALISLGLSELLLLELNEMLETDLHISLSLSFVLFMLLLMALVTLLAGFYPARVIAGYQPALALKNVVNTSGKKEAFLRKSLVTFQFFISQFFIIGTIVLIAQMDYVESLDLGFSTESVINVNIPQGENSRKSALKTALEQLPGVASVSMISATPASGSVSITDYDIGTEDELLTAVKIGDEDYFDVYDISFKAGEGLVPSDTINRLVVNEKWAQQSGFDVPADALGTMVDIWGYSVPVTGVVENFHTLSARQELQPIVIMSGLGNARIAGVKLQSGNLEETLSQIEKQYKSVYPEYTFDYEFLDQYIQDFYESERNMTRIFSFFAIVAIVIGMLGLFGLIAFTTERRLKEIGVRKVMGATISQIFLMFSWDVIKLVGIAFLFAAPLAWYTMTTWLDHYTYKIDLNVMVFFLGLGITALISLLTISYRSWQVAYTNPADTLRSE